MTNKTYCSKVRVIQLHQNTWKKEGGFLRIQKGSNFLNTLCNIILSDPKGNLINFNLKVLELFHRSGSCHQSCSSNSNLLILRSSEVDRTTISPSYKLAGFLPIYNNKYGSSLTGFNLSFINFYFPWNY